jgi:hypothetical protein
MNLRSTILYLSQKQPIIFFRLLMIIKKIIGAAFMDFIPLLLNLE